MIGLLFRYIDADYVIISGTRLLFTLVTHREPRRVIPRLREVVYSTVRHVITKMAVDVG